MQDANFDFVSNLVKQRSGLVLSKEKVYLLESRLAPIARQEELDDVDALLSTMRTRPREELNTAVVEAMTTNETFFFRDETPFKIFHEHILPYMKANRTSAQRMRIWCAAASTGQEPYSIAMILKENEALYKALRSEIVATDICSKVLEKAKAGLYTQFEVQRGMAMQRLVKFFGQEGQNWCINSDLKAMVNYRKFNLLDDIKGLGRWDVVFCRNVLIYFDQETKADILSRISKQMAPDGFLLLGAAETTVGISNDLSPVKGMRGLYQLSARANELAAAVKGAA